MTAGPCVSLAKIDLIIRSGRAPRTSAVRGGASLVYGGQIEGVAARYRPSPGCPIYYKSGHFTKLSYMERVCTNVAALATD